MADSPTHVVHIDGNAFKSMINVDLEAKQRAALAEWLLSIHPSINLPAKASEEELRACLIDGSVLCRTLNSLRPDLLNEGDGQSNSLSVSRSENVKKFLASINDLGIPRFEMSDLEKGSMKAVIGCLLALKAQCCMSTGDTSSTSSPISKSGSLYGDTSPHSPFTPLSVEERQRLLSDSKFQRVLRSPVLSDAKHQIGHKFHEVFQMRQGRYADLPAAKISEMMKSNSLDNAPTQSLLSVVNGILDESVEKKNGEIPYRVGCLLRKVVQEIERRISTQAEHLRTQNNLFKAREDKYQSRIRVLEALASGTGEESQMAIYQLKQIKAEKSRIEQRKKLEQEDMAKLMKEKDQCFIEISSLKQQLEKAKKTYEQRCLQAESEVPTTPKIEESKNLGQEESNRYDTEILSLKQELETVKKTYELRLQREIEVKSKMEESKNLAREERDGYNKEISALKQELEVAKKTQLQRETEAKSEGSKMEESKNLAPEERDRYHIEISALKQELETSKKTYELRCLQTEAEAKTEKSKLEEIKKLEQESMINLMKEKDEYSTEISALKQELETTKKTYEQRRLQMESEAKIEKSKMEESQKLEQEDMSNLMKEKEHEYDTKISELKQDLETTKKMHEQQCLQMETQAKLKIEEQMALEQEKSDRLTKERDQLSMEISTLNQVLETAKETYQRHCLRTETEANVAKASFEEKIKDLDRTIIGLQKKVKELEQISESNRTKWNKKETIYRSSIDFQFGVLHELKYYSESIKQEVVTAGKSYIEESSRLGKELKSLGKAAENYHIVLGENRKIYNELQELKGNIRVYCRIRPGQSGKKSTIESIGEHGELVMTNPAKPGKEGLRTYTFNKVFGPDSTQAEVFSDTQPLIRSVLDGYSVCIFAYGQTGSGKTHTMMGPTGATEEEWGVNYRALNDLFNISQARKGTIMYEIGVQMVEIYNEQVRDLLTNDGSQKRLGIKSTIQANGVAVPDASMLPVTSPSDVIELMETGLKNRAMSATALNERSSRSHSVVSIHVRGKDLKGGTNLQGNLHLVDLAGSERVDRSEVTGDRLKEAQHINKSLSALGDVIYALAQKSSHIPYRNSKLTQLLQSSLGGQAKTLMFVQLNPDINSFSESTSTLKFAERASGVELGGAKSSKDGGKDVRELTEQLASLKDTIWRKDEEIERLQLLKDMKNVYPGVNEKLKTSALPRKSLKPSVKSLGDHVEKAVSDDQNADNDERLSDLSDGGLSAGSDLDGSAENPTSPERRKPSDNSEKATKPGSKISRQIQKLGLGQTSVTSKESPRGSPASLKKISSTSAIVKSSSKRWA